MKKIRLIKPQYYQIAAEDIVNQILKLCFWLSWLIPFGAYKIYELIKPYFN